MKRILVIIILYLGLIGICLSANAAMEKAVHPLVKSLIEADLVVKATYLGMEYGKGSSAQGNALFEVETCLKGSAQGQLTVRPFDTIAYYEKGCHFILVLKAEGSIWVAVQPESMRTACLEIFQSKVVNLYQQVLLRLKETKNTEDVQGLLEARTNKLSYNAQDGIKITVSNNGSYLLRTHAVSSYFGVSIEDLVERKLPDGRYVVVNKTDPNSMRKIDFPGWLDVNESSSFTVQVKDLKLQSGSTYRIGISYQDFFVEKVAYTSDFVIN